MTGDAQRSLSGYKSKVHEQEDFESPNAGKPLLDDTEEYVLKLVGVPRVISSQVTKKKKDGTETKIPADKAVCEFEEKNTKNIVVAFFRIDSLNFAQKSDEEQFESGVIRFFKKIKHPLVEGVSPDWSAYFVPGMRFRSRVAVKAKVIDKDTPPVMTYFLDVPTCRPLIASDTAGEDFEKPPVEAPKQTTSSDATLANALFLAKGAVDYTSAAEKLKAANAPKDLVLALFQANYDGKLTFPI